MSRGTRIYGRLSRMLAMLPATTEQIADELDVARGSVCKWARHLRAEGLIGYGPMVQRHGRTLVVGNGRRFELARREASEAVAKFCRAWHMLATRHSTDDVAAAFGMRRRTVSEMLREMRTAGLIRVCGYELRGQTYAPIFDRLPAPDVSRPGREPRSDVNARYWAARRERMAAEQRA